jgi:Tetratricopeptide repeat
VADLERVLGPDDPDTLATRSNLAAYIGKAGDTAEAARLFTALLPDYERVLGPDHPDTPTIRSNLAAWTDKAREATGGGAPDAAP